MNSYGDADWKVGVTCFMINVHRIRSDNMSFRKALYFKRTEEKLKHWFHITIRKELLEGWRGGQI